MRILAAIPAALLASGALAQTSTPAAPAAEPAQAAPAAPAAPAAAPAAKKTAFDVLAERSNITISGRAWASLDNVKADEGSVAGASEVKARTRLSNNSSYLRFEGETELMSGWAALAQVEAEFGIEGESGTPFSGTRNTGVGLKSPFGTLILGRWDTPTKQTTIGLDPFGGTGIFGYYNVFGQQVTPGGTGVAGNGSNRWDRRANNSLNYTSPTFAGVKVLAQYSVGETPTNGAVSVSPWTLAGAVHYRVGSLYVGAAYETRNDCGSPDADSPATALTINNDGTVAERGAHSCNAATLATKGTDQAYRLGASYAFKPTFTKVAVAFEHVDLMGKAQGTLPKLTLRRDVYWASVTQGILSDTHQVILNYGYATDASGNAFPARGGTNDDTGAQYLTAAYRFFIGKSTDLYAGYTRIMNRDNGRYRIGSGGFGGVPVGSTTEGFGAGMRYLF